MAEIAEKPAERKQRRLSPLLTSAFVLTVLTAMFLLQGRAYREGWLGRFGLESAQFPISTADTYWLALHGWLNTALNWFNKAWDIYAGYLLILILPIAAFTFLTFVWEWHSARRTAASKQAAEDAGVEAENKVRQWLAADGRQAWLIRAGISLAIAPVSLAAFPLLLFLAGLLLVALIAITVVPFENVGKQAATDFCKRSVSGAARIVLIANAGHPEWGYRIECNSDACAMVRDGVVYVIPTRDIQRIELPAKGAAVKDGESESQLCPTPDESATVPT